MNGEPWEYNLSYAVRKNGRWEVAFKGEASPMGLREALNRLGTRGWELVGVVPIYSTLSAGGSTEAYGGPFGFGGDISCEQLMLLLKRRGRSANRETAV